MTPFYKEGATEASFLNLYNNFEVIKIKFNLMMRNLFCLTLFHLV